MKIISFYVLLFFSTQHEIQIHDLNGDSYTLNAALQKLFVLIFIIFILLVIVMTPLILFYHWITNFSDYHKNYNISKLQELSVDNRLDYRKVYSNVVGYGLGILAWIISSNFYIFKRFDEISVGFNDYFRFPFKVLNNISRLVEPSINEISPEVWLHMLLIVTVSIGTYIIGWFIGGNIAKKTIKKLP